MREGRRGGYVLVEARERHGGQGRPQHVERGDRGGGENGLRAHRADAPEPHVGHGVDEVFVKRVEHL